MSKELPEFHVQFARIQITDVDIPKALADVAEQTAIQEGKNDLAAKKELSRPTELRELLRRRNMMQPSTKPKQKKFISTEDVRVEETEIEMEWAYSDFMHGSNNVFGASTVIKGVN